MTRALGQVRPTMAACSSESATSPQASHPMSAAPSRPSSFLVLKAAAAPSPKGEGDLPMVALCENIPGPRSPLPPEVPPPLPFSRVRALVSGGDTPRDRLSCCYPPPFDTSHSDIVCWVFPTSNSMACTVESVGFAQQSCDRFSGRSILPEPEG